MKQALATTTLLLLSAVVGLPSFAIAQTESPVHEDRAETVPARVLEIVSESRRELPGLNTTVFVQTVAVEIGDGLRAGERVVFENEFAPLSVGDRIFVDRIVTINGDEYFIAKDVDRRTNMVILAALFVILVLWFAGWQGGRALFSLGLSLAAIFFLLIPALLNGWDPALASLAIAGLVMAAVLFGTHGLNTVSVTAFFGTLVAVALTCLIAYFFVSDLRFTGFSSDAAVFLNFATGGSLNFTGLLLGSIIIGMLGVLDDVSITQASVVRELKAAKASLGRLELYRRALRVGRDHVGSLVNTLALAYVGASLPLVLLLSRADTSLTLTLNQEVVAVEIARIIIGSIGIILAVPLTTALAAWYTGGREVPDDRPESGHHHTHGH